MKITNFCPMIATSRIDEAIDLFQELGFEATHWKEHCINGKERIEYIMRNDDGFELSIIELLDEGPDVTRIRMNVDNLCAASDFLADRGFENALGNFIYYDGSCLTAPMVAPTGFGFSLMQHVSKK